MWEDGAGQSLSSVLGCFRRAWSQELLGTRALAQHTEDSPACIKEIPTKTCCCSPASLHCSLLQEQQQDRISMDGYPTEDLS